MTLARAGAVPSPLARGPSGSGAGGSAGPRPRIRAPDPQEDFWRWTLPGLRLTCERARFSILESGVHMGPTSVLVSVAVRYPDGLLPGRLGPAAAYLSRFGFRPLLVLDRLWRHRPRAAVIASGVYVVGLEP